MSIAKDDVLAALGKIASPEGVPLPSTGKLSDIVVADGKVFFSITVDAGALRLGKPFASARKKPLPLCRARSR